uniref:Uncharacterized protein n=1 Tax=Tenacibaculum sp. Pbs-1 TaxID=3238748 RepID=A0AB33KS58_9FLAO
MITSSIVTSAVELCPDSFTAEVAICECSSIIPAVTYLPVPSITFAPIEDKLVPILAILPSLINTSVLFSTSLFSEVQTVAFLIKIVSFCGAVGFPNPMFG